MEQYRVIYVTGRGINRSISYLGRLRRRRRELGGRQGRGGFAAALSSPMPSDAPLAPTCSSRAHGGAVPGALRVLSCARRLTWPHQR